MLIEPEPPAGRLVVHHHFPDQVRSYNRGQIEKHCNVARYFLKPLHVQVSRVPKQKRVVQDLHACRVEDKQSEVPGPKKLTLVECDTLLRRYFSFVFIRIHFLLPFQSLKTLRFVIIAFFFDEKVQTHGSHKIENGKNQHSHLPSALENRGENVACQKGANVPNASHGSPKPDCRPLLFGVPVLGHQRKYDLPSGEMREAVPHHGKNDGEIKGDHGPTAVYVFEEFFLGKNADEGDDCKE